MKSKILGCLAVATLGAAIVAATPAMAFRGGFGGGGFHGGGFRGGGFGGFRGGGFGGFRGGGFGGFRGGFHGPMFMGRSAFVPGAGRFGHAPFAGRRFFVNRFDRREDRREFFRGRFEDRREFGNRFDRREDRREFFRDRFEDRREFGNRFDRREDRREFFRDRFEDRREFFRNRFFFNRFNNFAFAGAPFTVGFVGLDYGYNGCWQQVWTGYGYQWVDVCNNYASSY